MISVSDLLAELKRLGVEVWAEEGQLRLRSPKGVLSPELRDQLGARKQEILSLLSRAPAGPQRADTTLQIIPRDRPIPVSFPQARLWFLDQMNPGSPVYNVPGAVRLQGALDVTALECALNRIIERHEALRTNFAYVDGSPLQVISARRSVSMPIVDLTDRPDELRLPDALRLAADEVNRPFNLATDALIRAGLLRLGAEDHLLVLTLHHIIADRWSMGILMHEVATLYESFSHGRAAQLPELHVQYADYAHWQNERLQRGELDEQLSYWKQQLSGELPLLQLPTDRPRPAVQGIRGESRILTIPEFLTNKAKALARHEGATLFMTLLAVFKTLLFRYSGQEDILVGAPIANRQRAEVEQVIGYYANNLVLRTALSEALTFRELLARVKAVALAAYQHQDVPFEKLVEVLQPERSTSHSPIFQVLFNFHNVPMQPVDVAGLTMSPLDLDTGTAKFDLSMYVQENQGRLDLLLEYNADLFTADTVDRMLGHYRTLLEAVTERPGELVSELPLLTPAERSQVTELWTGASVSYRADRCIHELYEEQALRTPYAVAVIFEGQQLTYRALNERADRLASVLMARGVQPGDLVGICMERSLEMIVGLLAILKAGGAYVPLDPHYPEDRIAYILQDAHVRILLTQQRLAGKVARPDNGEVLLVDRADAHDAVADQARPSARVSPDDLSYVIYTSGSTGRPKGVMVTHRNVANFFAGMDQRVGLSSGEAVVAVTSIAFDISVLEIFWSLVNGAKVVFLSEAAVISAAAFEENRADGNGMEFSLFYFASDELSQGEEKYRLLIEGAKFADRRGFKAVWTPERHFHRFGGLYPNPSVVSAALAMVTERIELRAGSVVLPLHNPIRVAEEWAVVDNLSRGRVGLAFASGWHAGDFILAPDQYADRKEILYESIGSLQRLWRGETVAGRTGNGEETTVSIFPKPLNRELPIWITTGGSDETFVRAGQIGANVLTHLLGQSVEDLTRRIKLYRDALAENGHDPQAGHVTLMVHTFIGEDQESVRGKVRQPFRNYLRSSVDLLQTFARSLGMSGTLSDADMEAVLDHAFERYFQTSALFGTADQCMAMVSRLRAAGVDEIASLVDFGVDVDDVLASLEHLDELRRRCAEGAGDYSFRAQVVRHRPSLMQCTPSFMRVLLSNPETRLAMKGLHKVLLGGEALTSSLASAVREHLPARLFNMYGPTETTVWSTVSEIVEPDQGITIGRPIANTVTCVLGPRMQPVPTGVPGELYIGGAGVAHGYWNQEALTAERFVANPFTTEAHPLLYRTGDLVRYLPDGQLEYLGRTDFQVKLRGFRIELGEIERTLASHPLISEVVVTVVGGAAVGDQRLVAYFTTRGAESPAAAELRSVARASLPEFMVPSAFVMLSVFPLTPNGKIDRKALPTHLDDHMLAGRTHVPPRTLLEQRLTALWGEVLGVKNVGIEDNFFGLGGHSLLATQLIVRTREEFGVNLPLRHLFEEPTVSHLAAVILRELAPGGTEQVLRPEHTVESIPQRGEGALLPLSFGQQRLWVLDQFDPGSPTWAEPLIMIRLSGQLNVNALEGALAAFVRRHEILRTTFGVVDGKPVQIVHESFAWQMTWTDMSDVSVAERAAAVNRLASEISGQPFDLQQGPLFRATLVQWESAEHVLFLDRHQIISDGWSTGVLIREIAELYDAMSHGRAVQLPSLSIQYGDYAAWQRSRDQAERMQSELAYWKQQLADSVPLLQLPTDRPRPAIQSFAGATETLQLPAELVADAKALGQREGVTLFMTLLAAFQTLLYRYAGQEDILVGSPVANRDRSELQPLIGSFANTLALRTDLSGNPAFGDLLKRVKETAVGAFSHQHVPFEQIVDALQLERTLGYTPLFQVMFTMQNTPIHAVEMAGLQMTSELVYSGTAKFDLSMMVFEQNDALSLVLEYNTDLFEATTIRHFLQHFKNLLSSAVADPSCPISGLAMLTPAEERQLLTEWSGQTAAYPLMRSVIDLFEVQAERQPDAIAVTSGEVTISYGELNRRANQLARHLQRLGVEPEVFVGICVERSLEMLVAVLAVWKAGGAYLPLDPAYPRERLAYILADSGARVLLTTTALARDLPPHEARLVCLDTEWDTIGHLSAEPLTNATTGDYAAYLIYTSGSTGKPKGVVVSIASLTNAFLAWQESYNLDQVTAHLQMASFSFDVCTGDIVRALCSGGRLVLCPRDFLLQPSRLYELMRHEQVDCAEFVPAVLRNLLSHLEETDQALSFMRILIAGSDSWNLAEYRRIRQRCGPATRVINSFGVTEATIDTTFFEGDGPVTEGNWPVPIGRPFANSRVYILDRNLRPVPVGVPGELFIGGAGVARGYLNRPELTAERFLKDPFQPEPRAYMYRTGDRARFLSDGNVEFLGRSDYQVKIRGFRIELPEIELTLGQHPKVRESLVTVREDTPGIKRLVAYVVPDSGEPPLIDELHVYLKEKLPDYMVPTAFVFLDRFPLTPNGKLDRKSLPHPNVAQLADESAYVAPRNEVEEVLAAIWAELLGLERVGVHDNFFRMGGDSIVGIQVIARAHQAKLRLTPKLLFEYQTVAELARQLEQQAEGLMDNWFPLGPAQLRLLSQPASERSGEAVLLEMDAEAPADLVQLALERVVSHHEALRLTYAQAGTVWQQAVSTGADALTFTRIDLSHLAGTEVEGAVDAALAEMRREVSTSRAALLRTLWFSTPDGQPDQCALVASASAMDVQSWRILLEDLQQAVSQLRQGGIVELPAEGTSYTEWARRLAAYRDTTICAGDRGFWRERYGALSTTERLAAGDAGADVRRTSRFGANETRTLLGDALRAFNTRTEDLLLTALAVAANEMLAVHLLAVDVEGEERPSLPDVDLSRTVGRFGSAYPVLFRSAEFRTPGDAIKGVKEQLRSVQSRRLGYEFLLADGEELGGHRTGSQMRASFCYVGLPDRYRDFRVIRKYRLPSRMCPGSDVSVHASLVDGCLELDWCFSCTSPVPADADMFVTKYEHVLRSLITHCVSSDAGEFTPSDFPQLNLNQKELDRLLARRRSRTMR